MTRDYGTPEQRFDAHLAPQVNGCVLWTGTVLKSGYGELWANGRKVYAHRFAYERFVGPIPDGLTIDHLCRTPACVNHEHMEPVSITENVRRGTGIDRIVACSRARSASTTACPQGHPYDEANTGYRKRGAQLRKRYCLACSLIKALARWRRRQAARAA